MTDTPRADDIREPHLLSRPDFLGAFGVIERGGRTLFVLNERTIDGAEVAVWDLPGGQVEPGELLLDTLARELHEEIQVTVRGQPAFEYLQEGERVVAGRRLYAWRTFFFSVAEYEGEPAASSEIGGIRWMTKAEQLEELTAPYHDSYRSWLQHGGTLFRSQWID